MQNPPPGSDYGAAAAAGAHSKSAIGLDGNVASALGYPIGIIAIINLIMEKENKFVRFHAMQAILFFVLWIVLLIVLSVVSIVLAIIGGVMAQVIGSAAGIIVWLLSVLIWIVVPLLMLAGLIFAGIKAYQGQLYRLPLIGSMADKIVSK